MTRYRNIAIVCAVIAALCICVLIADLAHAATSNVTLQWTANTEPDLAGYKLYHSNVAGGQYTLKETLGLVTTATVTGLPDGAHHFVLTAFDTFGNESGYSNEASKVLDTASPATPKDVVITITVRVQ